MGEAGERMGVGKGLLGSLSRRPIPPIGSTAFANWGEEGKIEVVRVLRAQAQGMRHNT